VRSSPKPDPRGPGDGLAIDWRARQHTDAIPSDPTPEQGAPSGWLGDFLGVKRAKKPDLGQATGLKIRLPNR
jgi:hypothetical protein